MFIKDDHIVFTKVNTAELLEKERDIEVTDDSVLVETEFSSISCGTEKANILGDVNVGVFCPPSDSFPRHPGYSSSGRVIAKGEKVSDLEIGDTVVMSWSNHRKINLIKESNIVKFDSSKVTMQEAALCHICTFPMAAVRKTKVQLGESMLVMGLGILGLLSVIFAKQSGAIPVIAVDPVKERREKALEFGADYALDPTDDDFVAKVKELSDGGVNCAIEVTGLGVGLDQTLDCMAKFGRIALLGCTRDKNFTIDYYRKIHGPGIQLIGAHTMARPEYESHEGYFTQRDDIKTVLKLCATKRIDLNKIIDEVYKPEDCAEVYTRLIHDKNFPVISQFDWRDVKYEKN